MITSMLSTTVTKLSWGTYKPLTLTLSRVIVHSGRAYCTSQHALRGALSPVLSHAPTHKVIDEHKAHVDNIIQYLQEPLSDFLIKCKGVNFFVEDHWNQLPLECRTALSSCTMEELSMLPQGFIKDDFPESLKSFILKAREISLEREQLVDKTHLCKDKIFNSFSLNAKKEHELMGLGPVINAVCKKLDISWCIDIGAGQGFLSQMLVHQYGLNVLALDQSENNIQKSIKIGNKETLKNKPKKDSSSIASETNVSENTNKHVGKYVAAKMKLTQNTTLEEILKLAKETDIATSDDKNKMELFAGKNFLITGLHCCGGLSPTVMKMFSSNIHSNDTSTNSWKMKGMVLLSCCYHLLKEKEDMTKKIRVRSGEGPNKETGQVTTVGQLQATEDFPMSNYVAEKGIVLGRGAKVLACYAPDKYPSTPAQHHKYACTHAYRAALEVLILEHYKEFCDNNLTGVGHVGESFSKSFSLYAKHIITSKFKQPLHDFLTDEYLEAFWKKYEIALPTTSIFWTLRSVLAPVLETFILLDRQLFLEEKGVPATLVPIFNPAISPRNMALVAPY